MTHADPEETRQRALILSLMLGQTEDEKLFTHWSTDDHSCYQRIRQFAAATNGRIESEKGYDRLIVRDGNGYETQMCLTRDHLTTCGAKATEITRVFNSHIASSEMHSGSPLAIRPQVDKIDHLLINPITIALLRDNTYPSARQNILHDVRHQYKANAGSGDPGDPGMVRRGEFTVNRRIAPDILLKHNKLMLSHEHLPSTMIESLIGQPVGQLIELAATMHPQVLIKDIENKGWQAKPSLEVSFTYPLAKVGDVFPSKSRSPAPEKGRQKAA